MFGKGGVLHSYSRKGVIRVKKLYDGIHKVCCQISGWSVFVMMLVCLVDVIGRLFKHPLMGATDLVQILMVLAIFPVLGFIQAQDGNSKVELLSSHFSPRIKSVCNIFNSIIGLGISAILGYRLMLRAITTFQKHNFATMTLQIDLAPFLIIAAIGVFLLCIQFAIDLVSNLKKVFEVKEGKAV
jgi:TRAP-type C4-dicarboxylate transport system permease small subunit